VSTIKYKRYSKEKIRSTLKAKQKKPGVREVRDYRVTKRNEKEGYVTLGQKQIRISEL